MATTLHMLHDSKINDQAGQAQNILETEPDILKKLKSASAEIDKGK
ncbi:MAG: hypothetical protein HY072_06210 [Deltaproteobacteria bacterium]|nr:hypothetical protein [Deltaproteobacteria bacterium]